MTKFLVSYISLALIVILIQSSASKEVIVDLNAYYFEAAPDGVKRQVLGVNGQFPGPTIHANLNDTLVIRVKNSIQDKDGVKYPTSVHWHGIEMFLTPWFDGPEGVTQCPIPYGESMEYRFKLYQSGTYWYHSHHEWQYVEGFWGLLIIHNTPEVYEGHYDEDISIALSDWYHEPAKVLAARYHLNGTIPSADSGLINGQGIYPCPNATMIGLECTVKTEQVFRVAPGRTYRIRVINTSARSSFDFSIDGHTLRAIEVDGVDTVEVGPVDVATIWPAQRYSFLVTMNGQLDEYWIRADMTAAKPGVKSPRAILQYDHEFCPPEAPSDTRSFGMMTSGEQGRPSKHKDLKWSELIKDAKMKKGKGKKSFFDPIESNYVFPTSFPPADSAGASAAARAADARLLMTSASVPTPTTTMVQSPKFLDANLCRPRESRGQNSAPAYHDKVIVLNATFNSSSGFTQGKINGVSYRVDRPPVIWRMVKDIPINPNSNPQRIPLMKQVIQLVINNQNGGSHPWHLHGHTFWVLGHGQGNYNENEHSHLLNVNGVRRDTTETLGNSWVVVRFETDNPGAWLLHCHINWHLEVGLGAVFIEGEEELRNLARIPEETKRVCKLNGIIDESDPCNCECPAATLG